MSVFDYLTERTRFVNIANVAYMATSCGPSWNRYDVYLVGSYDRPMFQVDEDTYLELQRLIARFA